MHPSQAPPLPKSSRSFRIAPVASVLAQRLLCRILTLLFLAGGIYVALGGRLWQCLFYRAFHRPCLTCGMTRGVRKCLTGELETVWRFHPFAPFVVFIMGMVLLAAILPKPMHTRFVRSFKHWEERTRISLVLLVLFVIYGILRALQVLSFPY